MNSYGYDLHGSLEVRTTKTLQNARQSARARSAKRSIVSATGLSITRLWSSVVL